MTKTGRPLVLQLEDVEQKAPGPSEVWLEHDAIGVNYLDVTQRNGAVPITLPSCLGLEGAGRVVAIGNDVANVKPGDRVGYIMGTLGSYATGRLFPSDRLVILPDAMSSKDAASLLFKGATAQYLLKTTYAVGPGDNVLLYGAAGPLGQIMCSWAKHLGATVFGVVSRATSIERAQKAGAHHVLIWGQCNLPEEIERLTSGRKVDVVYDAVGKITFDASLDCLRPRGLMVSFGASSGPPEPVPVSTLNYKGSLYLTRPSLAQHLVSLEDYHARLTDVIDAFLGGIIRSPLAHTFPLKQASRAHELLEAGLAEGAVVLTP